MNVPFYRASIGDDEINEVVGALRSGWLTTGRLTAQFENEFAASVGARFAVAVNSCTAALHLAVEALGLRAGQAVLVPTMTFAATAEVVRYCGAVPVLVDCDPVTLNMDLADAARKIDDLRAGRLPAEISPSLQVVGIMPVHIGGVMMDVGAVHRFAAEHRLWVVEDAAHAFPAAYRADEHSPWIRCGEATADVTCFSFYANKTLTTGEGGMAVTDDGGIAERMRLMSLHGLSRNAWERYRGGDWDYRIVAPGFKYNLTDIASAIGIHQLRRSADMFERRQAVAARYRREMADIGEIEIPPLVADRRSSTHLFPIIVREERLTVDRNALKIALAEAGVGTSVHWRPLHLHDYYRDTFGWTSALLPIADAAWRRRLSLPLFPGMTDEEVTHVIEALRSVCRRLSRE